RRIGLLGPGADSPRVAAGGGSGEAAGEERGTQPSSSSSSEMYGVISTMAELQVFYRRSGRSAWKVAPSRALGPGIAERAPERPGKARKASNRRKFDSSLRQRVPFVGKTRPAADLNRSCRAWPNRRCRRNGTKSSFLESSRRALQTSANRQIQGPRSPVNGTAARVANFARRLLKSSRRDEEVSPGGARGRRKHTRHDAAVVGGSKAHSAYCGASPRSGDASRIPGVLRRRLDDQRSSPPGGGREEETLRMMRRRQERAHDGRDDARGGGRSKTPGGGRGVVSSSSVPLLPPADGAARPPGSLCCPSRPPLRGTGPFALRALFAAEQVPGRTGGESLPPPLPRGAGRVRSTGLPPRPGRPYWPTGPSRTSTYLYHKASPEGERPSPLEAGVARKESPTPAASGEERLVNTTLSWPKLLREQYDIEGIRLRLCGGALTVPRIPAVG
ncbi:hypothetical protein THAOC_04578, partial [Thalassiosira oceanica]